ncbi:MAG: type II toxin-antitoxin system VapC family toxin [Thermoguttaceae bacterium]|jgi:predicted nucleic acid-binding protein
MKYVLDASVALKWVLPEADSDEADALRDGFERRIHDLLAPDVFPVEVAHAVTKAERRGLITPARGSVLLSDVLGTLPRLAPSLPLVPEAYALASAARISFYDCLYVALAEREGCSFITADARLINALQKGRPFIVALSSL